MYYKLHAMDGRVYRRLAAFCLLILMHIVAFSQYFGGPNKPGYKIFEYKVYNTPHFELYHYLNSDSVLNSLAESSEKWYLRHQMIFKDTFKERNPIIFYSNHADFQQTNAIMGTIGVGTGGVTEALKNRVVLPLMESASQTDHVLGHELVHAFQYRLLLGDDSTQSRNLRNIPLWMIEGMAEYLSIGSRDANTAMWMRDAILNNDFPTLDDLTRTNKYFPYRYGQAFWAYITGIYGDTLIIPLFDLTTKIGYEHALDSLTVFNEKSFSYAWKEATRDYYYKFIKDTVEKPIGNKILSAKNSGTINIAPSLSPDGKYVIYLSEKDLFTFDLYMAYAGNGKIIRKISSTIRDNQIDDFNFLESGGAWSPDSRQYAFVTFSKGRNRLLVVDVKRTSKYVEYDIPNLEAFSNPTWSPNNDVIVVSGLVEGVTDLYAFNLKTNEVKNLTKDVYCNMMPSWSGDGKNILFSTDRPSPLEKDSNVGGYRIGMLNVASGKISVLPVFPGADNLNPQFTPDNKNVLFVSDADGFRNLFKYNLDSDKISRLTNLNTGISGITQFTPAFSVDKQQGLIVYTHYYKSEYTLYQAPLSSFLTENFDNSKMNFEAAHLPPYNREAVNIVNENIAGNINKEVVPKDSFKRTEYKPKFKLDYIGGSSMGVAVNSYYGTGMAGSVDMLFGDIVGNYQLFSSLALNGEIYDFAGSVAFINNKKKIDWGVSLSHIPYRNGYYSQGPDTLRDKDGDNVPCDRLTLNYLRIFEESVTLFATKPISQTQRIDAFSSLSYYSFRLDKYNYYYNSFGYNIAQSRERNLPTDKGFGIATIGTAYTLDNAYMGIASPLRGQRFRLETEFYTGGLSFVSFLVDYRKYFFINPFCIATRFYHLGRYGNSTSNKLFRALYIGWPWLVRGFDNSYFYEPNEDGTDNINQLFGSRIAVANVEFRIPFTGPERLCIIPFKYFISELSFFADAGMAWNKNNELTLNMEANKKLKVNYVNMMVSDYASMFNIDRTHYRYPMISYGVSLRINFFGYMVLEPYYAIPVMKNGKKYAGLGLNFLPGW